MPSPLRPLVVIPTYNERENLRDLIPAILEVDGRIHVLVVDDGSPDDTAGLIQELMFGQSPPRIFLEMRPGKLGLGKAYIHGFKWGIANEYDFLIEMDGDWSHPPRYLERMLSLSQEADFIVGSRYVAGGGVQNWGWGRRLLSRFGSLYSRVILGVPISDLTGGFNGWSSRVLREINLNTVRSDGYSFQIELKYRAYRLGHRHREFPILFVERRGGRSKMSASIALEALWRVWQFKLKGSHATQHPSSGQ
jgi:dolichol-phosphate mannosyltransferase